MYPTINVLSKNIKNVKIILIVFSFSFSSESVSKCMGKFCNELSQPPNFCYTAGRILFLPKLKFKPLAIFLGSPDRFGWNKLHPIHLSVYYFSLTSLL